MENWNYHDPLRRIASALEEIAKELKKANEKSGLLAKEAPGVTTSKKQQPFPAWLQ